MNNTTTKFEVYEDNAGGLFMVILDGECNPIRIFEGWQYCDGSLADALEQLKDDPTAYECWESDLMERLADEHETLGLPEITINEMYAELDGEAISLVADSDGIYPERMGTAASLAFGINGME